MQKRKDTKESMKLEKLLNEIKIIIYTTVKDRKTKVQEK